MPVIPTFDTNVGVPQPAGPPRIDPTTFSSPGAALAQDAGQVSGVAQQFAERYSEARRAADASNIVSQGVQQLGDARFKWSKVPDATAAYSGYQEEAAGIRTNLLANVQDPLVQSYVQRSIDPEIISGGLATHDASYLLERSAKAGDLDNNLFTYRNAIAEAPNDLAAAHYRDLAAQAIAGARAGGWIAPEDAVKRQLQFNSDIVTDHAKKMVVLNPSAAIAILSDPAQREKTWPGMLPVASDNLLAQATNRQYHNDMQAGHAEAHADAMAQANLRAVQQGNAATLVANALDPTQPQPSPGDLADMVRHQKINLEQMNLINGATVRGQDGHDTTSALIGLQLKMNQGTLTDGDISGAVDQHLIKATTGMNMLKANYARQQTGDNQQERAAFGVLKTALSGQAVEQGILKDNAPAEQLWGQAGQEWDKRVWINKEDPQAVLSDMLPRYAPPIASTGSLPVPRVAAARPANTADVAAMWQKTRDAHAAGTINDAQFQVEADTLNQYQKIFLRMDAARAARASVAPGGGAARATPPGGGAVPAGVVAAPDSTSWSTTP